MSNISERFFTAQQCTSLKFQCIRKIYHDLRPWLKYLELYSLCRLLKYFPGVTWGSKKNDCIHVALHYFSLQNCVCPRSHNLFYCSSLLYKMDQDFMDIKLQIWFRKLNFWDILVLNNLLIMNFVQIMFLAYTGCRAPWKLVYCSRPYSPWQWNGAFLGDWCSCRL